MTTSANRIQLKGEFRREEMIAAAALSPGHLVEMTSAAASGTKDTCQKHSTEGGYAERRVAVEDALQGDTIDDAYAADDTVSVNVLEPGAEVQMYLQAGESVTKGDWLISGGDGTLIANGSESSGTTVQQIVAVALETSDLSGSGASNTLIDVRVL